MGRVKKYENDEKAKEAQKLHIKLANQKYRNERKTFRENASNEQLAIIKVLNKTVIGDVDFLANILDAIEKKILVEKPVEEKEKETETETEKTSETETEPEAKPKVKQPRPKAKAKEPSVKEVIDADLD